MNKKEWWNCTRTIRRKDLMRFGWICSIPIIGWLNLIVAMLKKKTDVSITGWNPANQIVPKKETGPEPVYPDLSKVDLDEEGDEKKDEI